jgi:hypothetical protein
MSSRHYKIFLPVWAHWTAMDADGRVHTYQRRPEPQDHLGEWDERSGGEVEQLNSHENGKHNKNPKWYETLRYYE